MGTWNSQVKNRGGGTYTEKLSVNNRGGCLHGDGWYNTAMPSSWVPVMYVVVYYSDTLHKRHVLLLTEFIDHMTGSLAVRGRTYGEAPVQSLATEDHLWISVPISTTRIPTHTMTRTQLGLWTPFPPSLPGLSTVECPPVHGQIEHEVHTNALPDDRCTIMLLVLLWKHFLGTWVGGASMRGTGA